MTVLKSLIARILTSRHTKPARLLANCPLCTTLLEPPLLSVKKMDNCSSLTDRLSEILFKKLPLKKEIITARFFPKLISFQTWTLMRETKFVMH